jgi:hypothetical protein
MLQCFSNNIEELSFDRREVENVIVSKFYDIYLTECLICNNFVMIIRNKCTGMRAVPVQKQYPYFSFKRLIFTCILQKVISNQADT